MRRREKVPLYPYFHPQTSELWECILVEWTFALKFNNKSAEKCLKTRGPKLNPQLARRKNWERSREREERFSCAHITTFWLQNCENVSWLNGFLFWSFSYMSKMWLASFESNWGLLYWVYGALSDWFLGRERGFGPPKCYFHYFDVVCFMLRKWVGCFLHNFGYKGVCSNWLPSCQPF